MVAPSLVYLPKGQYHLLRKFITTRNLSGMPNGSQEEMSVAPEEDGRTEDGTGCNPKPCGEEDDEKGSSIEAKRAIVYPKQLFWGDTIVCKEPHRHRVKERF